jgi:hypothetical protein
VLRKKKQQTTAEAAFDDVDDAFSAAEEDDLFGSSNVKASSKSARTGIVAKTKGKLTSEERAARFEDLYQFLSDRIGLRPPAKVRKEPEQVRKTAWQHLFGLATTAEQLERVTELFPKWRESRQQFTPKMAEAFVRMYTNITTMNPLD